MSSGNASCAQYGGCPPQPMPHDSNLPYTGYATGLVLIVGAIAACVGLWGRRLTR